MCVVSMIGDHYRDKFTNPQQWPGIQPYVNPSQRVFESPDPVSRREFEALKLEVAEMKLLLARAREYDQRNGEPACEMEEKVAILRRAAELVGVGLGDVLPVQGGAK